MERLAEQILIDIVKKEMEIGEENAWVRDQNKKIPNDKGLYIVAGLVDSIPLSATGSVKYTDDDPPKMSEIQQVNTRDSIQIDITSRSNDALKRRWEILAALRSIYSIQLQEKYFFKIAHIPSGFANTSPPEGGSVLNRFSIIIPCLVWYRKEKVVSSVKYDYYNDFDTRVDDYKSITEEHGIIEFNIKEED